MFGFPCRYSTTFAPVDADDDLRVTVKESMQVCGWRVVMGTEDSIVGKAPLSWQSFGERITAQFLAGGSLQITSECTWPLTLMDYGKNEANVRRLVADIKRHARLVRRLRSNGKGTDGRTG